MEHKLYKAACLDDIEYIKRNSHQQLNLIVTPNNNTILHIHIAFCPRPSANWFVEKALKICPQLLIHVNDNGDTPLHVAAKQGLVDIIEVLINHAKDQPVDLEGRLITIAQMLRMTNKDGNTALHEVAQNHNTVDAVKLFMKEDPSFPYDFANNCGETPLYIAASRGSLDVVVEMLGTCTPATYNYKNPRGMTILHAAVRRNHPDITKKILEKTCWSNETDEDRCNLTKEKDENGWIPLHHAAYYGHRSIVKLLLEFDASAACIVDKRREMTALHLAAGQGHFLITSKIMISCPSCIEQVDNRGWNYVHFYMCTITTPFGLRPFPLVNYLLNAMDLKGNTPLLVLASISQNSLHAIKGIKREVIERTMHTIRNQEEQVHQLKNEVMKLSKERDEPYKLGVICLCNNDYDELCSSLLKEREMYLVVATLIATVTFAAGLTLPGGYIEDGSNQGTANLIRNSAFQAFVISDAIALVLSVLAVLFHILWQLQRLKEHLSFIMYAHLCTIYALVAMVVAFVTGIYAVLRPSSGLAITTVIVGSSFFLIHGWFGGKLAETIYSSRLAQLLKSLNCQVEELNLQ